MWKAFLGILGALYVLTYFDTSYRRDGKLWPWFQKLKLWKYFQLYFCGKISLEEPLDHDQLYIFGCFPHGTCTLSHFLTMTDCCEMLSKHYNHPRRDLAASILFFIPFIKDILMWLGNVDASSHTARYNLKKGRSLLIFVGGEKEQLLTVPGENKIVVSNRKGFVRLSLAFGAHLVPMYVFGENELFNVSTKLLGFRKWLQKSFQIGLPIFWGRWGTLVPFSREMTVEIGKPIPVPIVEHVSDELVDQYHTLFVNEMKRLFDRTKVAHGYSEQDSLTIL